MALRKLPIGNDEFREIREQGYYYVDKSLLIRDFLETGDKVSLITRPRRFGKTLNMTMLREFFDIAGDSRELFRGLAVMDTQYAAQMNSRPVIYLSFRNCKGNTADFLARQIQTELAREYNRISEEIGSRLPPESYGTKQYRQMLELLGELNLPLKHMASGLAVLTQVLHEHYGIAPLLLIDEYDQPVISSYENGYHDEMGDFFSVFYGMALKGNPHLGSAFLTGIQRVAKESIFFQLNNLRVYTVFENRYAAYFGLTEEETGKLLSDYGLPLNQKVREMYDGYYFGQMRMYNPWSILNYADSGFLGKYWVNTSSNYLVRQALTKASRSFWDDFDILAGGGSTAVWLNLDTSYIERESNYSLWGLLVNAGYITAEKRIDADSAVVRIPNEEVMGEFLALVTEISGMEGQGLGEMFSCLIKKDIKRFLEIYQELVISCTSYMDGKENAYHMLFLGMCMSLRGSYQVESNLESGYGRSDIILKSRTSALPSVIIEFKQGKNIEQLKEKALQQIFDQKYYMGLTGEVLCIGLAHDKKRCAAAYKMIRPAQDAAGSQ